MGFDIFLTIKARTDLKTFLRFVLTKIIERWKKENMYGRNDVYTKTYKENPDEYVKRLGTDFKLRKKNIKRARRYFEKIGHDLFYKKMSVLINMDNIDINTRTSPFYEVTFWEVKIGNISGEYLDYFSIRFLLEILDTNPTKITEYLHIFDDMEDIKVKEKGFSYTIDGFSSYKGGEELNINYKNISKRVDWVKEKFPDLKIVTKLGMC